MDDPNKTLGFHRDMSAALFGLDSHATRFLDEKIAQAPRGRDEELVIAESQLIMLLASLAEKDTAKLAEQKEQP